ncbi:MAG: alkaline phosphatase family protein [Thermodesulfobacteriota bacterium]|nr:alkaline phosphatase family protein [Thermodesulfobacteriota bacterium]
MNRREFLKTSAILALGCSFLPAGCWFNTKPQGKKKVIVLGIDGMDTHLTREYMRQGLLPNFAKLAKRGCLRSVGTSMPPQSPVAWSNFIIGASSSVHGIYDFIHRDPLTLIPYLSTSHISPPGKTFDLGDWRIPLSRGQSENLRKGKPFWEYLAEYDIPTTIFKMPANFPCESEDVRMVSGMGTPDLRGGYGSFTLITTAPNLFKKDMTGGKLQPITFHGQKALTHLPGPANTMKRDAPHVEIPLEIWRDRDNAVVRILIQNNEFLLRQGEWTGWIQLSFPMLGSLYDVKGICKLYVKSVHPDFTMYISPLNIDPSDPALPVVTSKNYGEELVRNVGHFYTQGFPEDTKALSEGVLSEREYLTLGYQIIEERKGLLEYEMKRFRKQDTGMFFFYFSSLDQNTHMYWRTIDPYHPLYNRELYRKYGHTLKELYIVMDKILGDIMKQNDINDPNLSLMVMSDHGFTPFRRQVNVNNWLFEKGYLSLSDSNNIENKGYFENVNWSRTSAYNVGINSIYVNLKGRERNGIVSESQASVLLRRIRQDLLSLVDVTTGKKAVSRVLIVSEHERRLNPHAPDLIIGWNIGYRTSWESILGGFSCEIIADNLDKWSGDHCVDPSLVPAILFANKRVTTENVNLCDITATILAEFNISPDNEVQGKPLYSV